ncbi:phosphate acyltransferase PlsX [Metamycoplasma faucium]|uniref:Phosphate acyltransferase n=1 Tax=Metamycoplasma faucium TaxID=56142 RepID=A0ABZ2TQA7_9BACT
MKKIIFDLLNNDGGELEAIKAAKKFAIENPNYYLILVGNEKNITSIIDINKVKNIEIFQSDSITHKVDNFRELLRQKSSMLDSFDLIETKNADGLLSSGDSGAFISIATLKIKRLNGVSRPAFMPIIPSILNSNFFLLDVGANLEIKPNYLFEWAIIANIFYSTLYGNKVNNFGILNIGTEDYKGLPILKEANELIKNQAKKIGFNYKGFVEPSDLIEGKVNVALSDGYAGNIFLKTLESSFMNFGKLFKNILLLNLKNKIAGLLIKKDLIKLKKKFDYRNTGGAFIVGLEKVIVKAHGRSDEIAFYNALNQIKIALENNIVDIIKNKLDSFNGGKNE